jgi:hypothetical protein
METARAISEVQDVLSHKPDWLDHLECPPCGRCYFGGRALLDLVIGVDSLDAFMLTGLGNSICSPPRFFWLASGAWISPYPIAHAFIYLFFSHVFHDLFTFSQLRTSHLALVTRSRSMSYHVVCNAIPFRET